MNVYVMYKFEDYKAIQDSINVLESTQGIKVFYFVPNLKYGCTWKTKAREKIKAADAVCYFFNFETAKKNTRNLQWEYNYAVKNNKKVIIIDINNQTDILDQIKNPEKKNHFFKDIFNYSYNEKEISSKAVSLEQGKKKLVEQSSWNIGDELLIEDVSDIDNKTRNNYYSLLIQQYKIMVDTSEKLMERRQATSNVYTSICTALVALIGSSFALKNMYALSMIFFCVGLVTIILAANWRGALDSYDRNNEGKFAVLNEIEKKLPANMFDSEYRYNKSKGIKSFAFREKLLPSIFKILGFIFLACSVIFLVLKCVNIDFFAA